MRLPTHNDCTICGATYRSSRRAPDVVADVAVAFMFMVAMALIACDAFAAVIR